MSGPIIVGLIANPASARDIRRLVADASVVTTAAKINILRRVLAGLGSCGVDRVLCMRDLAGISGRLEALSKQPSAKDWPELEFIDHPISQTAADTRLATAAAVEAGAGAIVVLGGDGTSQVVAGHAGDVPLMPISTGTNNAFPSAVEPTVAGVAAGLIATGQVSAVEGTHQAKYLEVASASGTHRALVDVAVIDTAAVGSGAIWEPEAVGELFLAIAQPDAIGLSSIGGCLQPVSPTDPRGLALRLTTEEGSAATATSTAVAAVIGPGLIASVTVASNDVLQPDQPVGLASVSGVVALDGERAFALQADQPVTVTLRTDGPHVIDPITTLTNASISGARSPRRKDTLCPN